MCPRRWTNCVRNKYNSPKNAIMNVFIFIWKSSANRREMSHRLVGQSVSACGVRLYVSCDSLTTYCQWGKQPTKQRRQMTQLKYHFTLAIHLPIAFDAMHTLLARSSIWKINGVCFSLKNREKRPSSRNIFGSTENEIHKLNVEENEVRLK